MTFASVTRARFSATYRTPASAASLPRRPSLGRRTPHEENCEAELAAEIDSVLDKGRLPTPNDLKARFAPDPGKMPRIDVARTHLAGYGSLLGAGGAS